LPIPGLDVVLCDTAGLDDDCVASAGHSSIDHMAQQAAMQQAQYADLRLVCCDASSPLSDADRFWHHRLLAESPSRTLAVWTKCDVSADASREWEGILTSSETGKGVDDVLAAIRMRLVEQQRQQSGGMVESTAARCQDSLRRVADSLQSAYQAAKSNWGEELVTADLRVALGNLGEVLGVVYTEDVLDRVFNRFCIGK
ncbi:MAG: hypothetical protein KDA60_00135, partial [Planctomycetales bacterium]|nr:hypothetical protein [Planctomycetales bacterium]